MITITIHKNKKSESSKVWERIHIEKDWEVIYDTTRRYVRETGAFIEKNVVVENEIYDWLIAELGTYFLDY